MTLYDKDNPPKEGDVISFKHHTFLITNITKNWRLRSGAWVVNCLCLVDIGNVISTSISYDAYSDTEIIRQLE